MDKKLTGLTEHQKNLILPFFYQGKNDKEIQKELDIGSTSTILSSSVCFERKGETSQNLFSHDGIAKRKR